jgi:ABC-type Fe3+-hydroxamate transport system substrate-binding protein
MNAARRVVSLVPSLTETLFDLGAGADVIGITDYCIFPPSLALPRLGGTKNPRIEKIRALTPDLVYMNTEENLKHHAEAIEQFARVHLSEPRTIEDVERLIAELGEIHDRRDRANELVALLRDTRASISQRTFTFAVPIWKNPWMWCGGDTYVSHLVQSTGGRNVLGNLARYPTVTLDEVLAMNPDVIFLPDEPYAFNEADANMIRAPRVIGPFPGHLFTWHGTRTLEGLRFLREIG